MESNIHFISKEFKFFVTIAKKYLPHHLQHLIEDVAQDAVVLAIEKIELFDSNKGNLKSWLFRITQNVCFDYSRKFNKTNFVPLNNLEFKLTLYENQDEEIRKTKVKRILIALKKLNKREQELVKYKFIYNFSGKELAELLNIPEKQINVYVKRAKEKLLRELNAA